MDSNLGEREKVFKCACQLNYVIFTTECITGLLVYLFIFLRKSSWMFSLFISLRISLKTAFVKELLFFKNKYKRGVRLQRQLITRGPRFHAAGDFGARCCCVFFARLSLKGEIASERTQAFTLSKETIEGITYLDVRLFRYTTSYML